MPASTEQVKRVPLFADLDAKELKEIAGSFKQRDFSAGETIASEGAGGVGFFIIDQGEAKVMRDDQEVARLGPGDYFGELALIDEGTRTATLVADSDMVCYGLTSWEFRPLVTTNSQIAWKLLEALAKQLRQARS